ncbi:MAG: alpha/beta hydrolase fold domain-containing protein [Bacteroidales bacterium]|nr:alpha/beta hydrolase fold domain-containing protein [Bacteroidales bacterium]
MKKILMLAALLICSGLGAQELSGTYMVAQRDTCNLYMDVYLPAPGSETTIDGIPKPTVLYVFGGGFIMGRRDDPFCIPWFKTLTENGYGVVSVDYRLGLKGQKLKFDLFHIYGSAKAVKRAVDIGVEDVFAAVRYLCDNPSVGIDPYNMVISGSSAGAMISLSSALETCSPTERTAILPEGFRFKGVMSFAGSVMSDSGVPKYASEPAPHLFFHGTEDAAVVYDKTAFGNMGAYGSSSLVKNVFSRNGYVYEIYRYIGHGHDIAAHMLATWPEQKRFLEVNVVQGKRRIVDASLDDPTVPVWSKISVSLDDIY